MEDLIKVCIEFKMDCGNEPHEVTVGNLTHTFCCEKGFKKSLDDFNKSLNIKPITHEEVEKLINAKK